MAKRSTGSSNSGGPNRRNVVPAGSAGWAVKKPGANRASSIQPTQGAAIDRARKILENDGGGELTTHGRDGKIRDSDTVGGGNDPNPPKDTK
jgi:hypothetical protein